MLEDKKNRWMYFHVLLKNGVLVCNIDKIEVRKTYIMLLCVVNIKN